MPVPDKIPINWHPIWPGKCDGFKDGKPCETESLLIMCTVDDDTHEILEHDTWVHCSWCGKPWNLKQVDRAPETMLQ